MSLELSLSSPSGQWQNRVENHDLPHREVTKKLRAAAENLKITRAFYSRTPSFPPLTLVPSPELT